MPSNESKLVKVDCYIDDWRSWVAIWTAASDTQPWPQFPVVEELKKELPRSLSYLRDFSESEIQIKKADVYGSPVGGELPNEWFINQNTWIWVGVSSGLRSCDQTWERAANSRSAEEPEDKDAETYNKKADGENADDTKTNSNVKSEKFQTYYCRGYEAGFRDGFRTGMDLKKKQGTDGVQADDGGRGESTLGSSTSWKLEGESPGSS